MYVLVYKGNVISGPSNWNKGIFDARLEDEGVITYTPRSIPPLPYVINEDARILECDITTPEINSKIEYIEGPFITDVTGDKAIGHFNKKEKRLEDVKYVLKEQVAQTRYTKECEGTTVSLNGQDIFIDTNRGVRDMFVQKYLMMQDGTTANWKFPSGFLSITKAELGQIVTAGAQHIQTAFDWEETKHAAIDACQTLQELDAIVTTE